MAQPDRAGLEQPFGNGESEDERAFRARCAALILFEPEFSQQMRALYGDQAAHYQTIFTAGLRLYRRLDDGVIYFYPTCPIP